MPQPARTEGEPAARSTLRGPARRPVLLGAAGLALVAVPVGVIGLPRLRAGLGVGGTAVAGSEEAVAWAVDAGVLEDGIAAGAVVDRAGLARALHRAAGSPVVPSPAVDPAVDLGEGEDREALLWLLARGALTVDGDFAVQPDREVTRAEGAAALARLLQPSLRGLGVAATVPEDATDPALGWLDASGMIPAALREDPVDTAGALTAGELAQVLRRSEEVVAKALA